MVQRNFSVDGKEIRSQMGTVDYLGRFLDVQIQHPASTSDFLAFATSDLKAKLDQLGFLSRGLVIFGDNAYSNSEYMVTPFKGSTLGSSQDSFNFYHSQLRQIYKLNRPSY